MLERFIPRQRFRYALLALVGLVLAAVTMGTVVSGGPSSFADNVLIEASRIGLVDVDDLSKHSSQEAASALAEARFHEVEGDTGIAIEAYRALVTAFPRSVESVDAYLDLGRAYLSYGQASEAVQALETYQRQKDRQQSSNADVAADDALAISDFLLGRAYRETGDVERGLAAMERYRARQTPAEPYVRLEMAEALLSAQRFAEVQDLLEPVTRADLPATAAARTREMLAQAAQGLGDASAAADWLLRAAKADSHVQRQADLTYRAAVLYHDAGRTLDAQRLFLSLVTEYPRLAISAQALDQLDALQVPVSDYFRGDIYYWLDRNDDAIVALDRLLRDAPDDDLAPQAFYYRALAYRDRGDRATAAASLREMARVFPGAALTADALWQAGQILEGLGQIDEAIASYKQLTTSYPSSDRVESAFFRQGLLQYRSQRYADAARTWSILAASASSGTSRTRDLLWVGKALLAQGQSDAARQRFDEAARSGSWDYYVLRARNLLDNAGQPGGSYRSAQLRGLSDADLAEAAMALAAWGARSRQDWATPDDGLKAEPAFQRGDELMKLGLRDYAYGAFGAVGEFNRLLDRHSTDPATLYQLSLYFRDRGIYYLSINAAYRLLQVSPVRSQAEAPTFLLKLLYPAYYARQVDDASRSFGVDPLLVLALIRQESSFEAAAGSSAGALGLTQVMPSTGKSIAQALGVGDFHPEDLRQPSRSVPFGAWYLADALKTYQSNALLSLAAYNSGGGNISRWLQGNPDRDPDLFVESISFGETHSYVRLVLQNLAMYERLYLY